jgi:hypothetical protein
MHFATALRRGSALAPYLQLAAPSPASAAPKLASAEEMEAATGLPASWFASQARERRIPFRKLGRYVRSVLAGTDPPMDSGTYSNHANVLQGYLRTLGLEAAGPQCSLPARRNAAGAA